MAGFLSEVDSARPGEKISSLNQTLATDLAVLQHKVEQLFGKQEQMSRDIAAVQAAEQNVSEKISSLTRLFTPRGEKATSQGLCTRKAQENQLHHLSARRGFLGVIETTRIHIRKVSHA